MSMSTQLRLLLTLLALVVVGCAAGDAGTANGTTGPSNPTADAPDDAPHSGSDTESHGTVTAGEPVRIGVLAPTSGPQTQLGREVVDAINYYVSQHPEAGGRPIDLLVEDTASNPRQGQSQAQKLVDADVAAVVGVVHSSVLQTVSPFLAEQRVPLILTTAASDTFTTPPVSEYSWRAGNSASQNNRVLGWYAREKLGAQRAAIITYDFIAGEEFAGAFSDVFTQLGGEITSEQKVPLGTADYASYISAVPDDIDVLYVFVSGPDAVRFWEQAATFGLGDRVDIIGGHPTLDSVVLSQVGEAADGFIGPYQYLTEAPIDGNEQFVSEYTEAVGRPPTFYAVDAYVGMQALAAALEATGGDSSAEAITAALPDVNFEAAPRGPFRFADNHQATYTVYLARAQGGAFEILDEVPDVTQDWTPS